MDSPAVNITIPATGSSLNVGCVSILDRESHSHVDELSMYRTRYELRSEDATQPNNQRHWDQNHRRNHGRKYNRAPEEKPQTPNGSIVSIGCGRIHKDRNNYVEEAGKYTYIGQRHSLNYGYFQYEVKLEVENSTVDDQGMYVCSVERRHDRLYTSTLVRHGGLPMNPRVEIFPCEAQRLDSFPFTLYMVRGRPTCLRCRGIGYPIPRLIMHKGKNVLRENRSVSFDSHINVADGGIAEITYTFWNPSGKDSGEYTCFAMDRYNSNNESSATFWIQVRDP